MSDTQDGTYRWQRRERMGRGGKDKDSSPTPASKPPAPIILGLARPSASQSPDHQPLTSSQQPQATHGDTTHGPSDGSYGGAASGGSVVGSATSINSPQIHRIADKPIVVLKSRDDTRVLPASASAQAPAAPQDIPHPTPHLPSYPVQQQRHSLSSQQNLESGIVNRLAPPPEMKHSVKLIDENFRWVDAGIDELVEQSDYLVVGTLGLQGTGKSTILSLLGGNTPQDAYRNYIFQPQTKETREEGSHQSVGVDMFATPERIILLDSQPVLSPSILDCMIRHEKKYPADYTSTENWIEMQSLQIATFLMTVCHVIIVTQDWFTDLNFLKFLTTAEMLKPQMHSTSHESSQEDSTEFYPTIVFVMNKAGSDDFTPETYANMQVVLDQMFHSSKLKYKGAVSMKKDNIISVLKAKEGGLETDVNLFLLPVMEYYKTEPESILSYLPEYRGCPSFAYLLRSFRNQVYSMPKTMITQSQLSERNWFHFAARMWEAVKKSQLLAEYNRLLP
ncbi:hypothetical protein C0Q70_10915 [Pomacea canaliculata]|uniref:Protein SMG9 n=2 Tax=Pomacea canaliculata TaxID=400727 RepID=A0A2T7P4I9_POMCA|nr:hypothetical protein C0Q70_10915 [Pomacea canaliculata]